MRKTLLPIAVDLFLTTDAASVEIDLINTFFGANLFLVPNRTNDRLQINLPDRRRATRACAPYQKARCFLRSGPGD